MLLLKKRRQLLQINQSFSYRRNYTCAFLEIFISSSEISFFRWALVFFSFLTVDSVPFIVNGIFILKFLAINFTVPFSFDMRPWYVFISSGCLVY